MTNKVLKINFTEEFINDLKIDLDKIVDKISQELNIPSFKVKAVINLLKDSNTVPFIARYRKEAIGFLNEVEVRNISHLLISNENLETRRIEIIRSIFSQGKLTEELYSNIVKATNYSELEDLYIPYKKKKKTKGMIAIEKGLEELANLLESIEDSILEKEAERFISEEKGVNSIEEAIQGAMDIVAERISHDIENRKLIKNNLIENSFFVVKGLKEEESSVYKMYYNYKESLKSIKPHRILAINRGERDGELEVKIDYEYEEILDSLVSRIDVRGVYHKKAIEDGLKRLLLPAVEREIRSNLLESADKHGINVFSDNLKNLLMQPPIKKTRVLGIDPGIRTGSKGAALSETGKYLGYIIFFQEKKEEAKKIIAEAIKRYNIELIAIGNGTGSYEVQQVVCETINEFNLSVQYTVVAEDGASVYSASDIAREEFPDLDLTIRGAISIGRRIQDPLAELVKIDPKSIGVGLYQHDVNQVKLSKSLDEVVESVVNSVGVNINTASYSLLKYVSGINTFIAKNIIEYRDENGLIRSREELKKIAGIGEKTFEQCAGFIKIPESPEPLDNSWVHPENYDVARKIQNILLEKNELSKEDIQKLERTFTIGETTIKDIIDELKKPNRDPREDYPKPILQKGVISFEDLKVGMKVTGKVKNVVDFGAFVDIGIKETALIHISQMSDKFIKSPSTILKVGDIKEFNIIDIDPVRKRISLSLKDNNNQDRIKPKLNYRDYIISD